MQSIEQADTVTELRSHLGDVLVVMASLASLVSEDGRVLYWSQGCLMRSGNTENVISQAHTLKISPLKCKTPLQATLLSPVPWGSWRRGP